MIGLVIFVGLLALNAYFEAQAPADDNAEVGGV